MINPNWAAIKAFKQRRLGLRHATCHALFKFYGTVKTCNYQAGDGSVGGGGRKKEKEVEWLGMGACCILTACSQTKSRSIWKVIKDVRFTVWSGLLLCGVECAVLRSTRWGSITKLFGSCWNWCHSKCIPLLADRDGDGDDEARLPNASLSQAH